MARVKKKTKAELLQEAITEAVSAGDVVPFNTVDFADPLRPKTCIEVDFPIVPVNQVASLEASSGAAAKPVYQVSKWWARRPSSVFRSMLLASAVRAPEDEGEAASVVWNAHYHNHQQTGSFANIRALDIFMGGGTTIVEGGRLGMQMVGFDLNPVAWLVSKNAADPPKRTEIEKLLAAVESNVKPLIMPFYAAKCPRGHSGTWTNLETNEVMGDDFQPHSIPIQVRSKYRYHGPELIYTYWAKHGPCLGTECSHRTPILSSPTIITKSLSVNAWRNHECRSCSGVFDVEQRDARLSPDAAIVVSESEPDYAIMDASGRFACPHCGVEVEDEVAKRDGNSSVLGKSKSKKVDLSLLLNKEWLNGSEATKGGSADDEVEDTIEWLKLRNQNVRLIEVRGKLPDVIQCPYTGAEIQTGKIGGNVPAKSKFKCQSPTCGRTNDVLEAIKATKKTGPTSIYCQQVYCPICEQEGDPSKGRFYVAPTEPETYASAAREWERRSLSDLESFWPKSELPFGFMTHLNNGGIPNHGMTHWWKMFNHRQLLVHAQLLNGIMNLTDVSPRTREYVLGVFQQYLRFNCYGTIWHQKNNQISAFFSSSNFQVRSTYVETGVFSSVGDGSWTSAVRNTRKGLDWQESNWELVAAESIRDSVQLNTKSYKIPTGEVVKGADLACSSASQLESVDFESIDLVITDPPFGGLLHYSELSDFFYVWLRLALKEQYPSLFTPEFTPKALEAVANRARHKSEADSFYQRMLTECWREARRVLKKGGILAFTFHHSEDEPWIAVLESLFDAGFYLEAAYPIRSDQTRGEGSKPGTLGSQKIEYDIIHVCRKRTEEPKPISWARLRKQIMRDVSQLRSILEQHQESGLGEADLQVIRRGKALEYFSRHYGKVYIERGREDEFTVKDALVGINQLLDDESDASSESPPISAEPYTRQFLRLFADRSKLERDQVQKFLRGTGVSPTDFLDREWCTETKKVFTMADPMEWARVWKGKPRRGMSRDFDQAYFLIGASYEDSGIRISDTLKSGSFVPHPAISDLLDWFARHGYDQEMKDAAARARQIYKRWENENSKEVAKQATLFDMDDDD